MILRKNNHETLVTAVVIALTVAGILTGPAIAHAYPCGQWAFSGPTSMKQSNGWTTYFDSTEPRALGAVEAVSKGGHMKGTIEGGINGRNVSLVARWASGPIGQYNGQIDDNGYMKGITYDRTAPNSSATWYSDQRLSCLRPAP